MKFFHLVVAAAVACVSAQTTDLSTFVASSVGFDVRGYANGGNFGMSVASIGDFNGDGIGDFCFGGRRKVYVLIGDLPPYASINFMSIVSGNKTLVINPTTENDALGFDVGAAGDVNHDGLADIIAGAGRYSLPSRSQCGAAHIIFGFAGPYQDLFLANLLQDQKGFTIFGPYANAYFGNNAFFPFTASMRGNVGDVNNDGINDIAVSLRTYSYGSLANSGAAWLLFGRLTNFTNIDLANVGPFGIRIRGARAQDNFGAGIDGVGDFNGDGIQDFIVGAPSAMGAQVGAGSAYLFLGGSSLASLDMLSFSTGSMGVAFVGAMSQSLTGASVLGPGDINGDGLDDVAIGCRRCTYMNRDGPGRVFVVYGTSTLPTTDVLLPALSPLSGGYVAHHVTVGAGFGRALSRAGDINGDGYVDFVAGGGNFACILYGGPSPPAPIIDVTNNSFVWKFTGSALGEVLSGGHDMSGDGIPDLLFGCPGLSYPSAPNAGGVFFVRGPFNVFPSAAPTELPSFSPTATPTFFPSAAPTEVPSFSPTATPTTAVPTTVPTAAPTEVCVQWILGAAGESCASTCSANARECKSSYFEDILSSDSFEDMVSSTIDASTGETITSVQQFCSGGVNGWPDQGGPVATSAVLHTESGNIVRRFCAHSSASSSLSLDCNASSNDIPYRRFCPCVYANCDVVPWFLGYSGDSCTTTCSAVGRVCDADLVRSISDRTAFDAMVSSATSVETGASAGTCSSTNAPQLSAVYPSVVTINVPGNINVTFCSHPSSVDSASNGDCGAAMTGVQAQRFCPCKYPKLSDVIEKSVHLTNLRGSKV